MLDGNDGQNDLDVNAVGGAGDDGDLSQIEK